jgi:hypothetical protein
MAGRSSYFGDRYQGLCLHWEPTQYKFAQVGLGPRINRVL